jgi:hypothetical protein
MLTTKQVAERLGVNPSRVRQIAGAGIGTKIGRDWMFTEEEVLAMEARKTKPGPATLRDLAGLVIDTGMVTDPMLGERQAVAVRRALFDQFAAAVAAAPAESQVAEIGRQLVASAELHPEIAYLPIPALDALHGLLHPPLSAEEWAGIRAEVAERLANA